jgi:hypothetical protein
MILANEAKAMQGPAPLHGLFRWLAQLLFPRKTTIAGELETFL